MGNTIGWIGRLKVLSLDLKDNQGISYQNQPEMVNQDKLFKSLSKDLDFGHGDSYAVPYLMLQYGSKALNPLLKGLKCPSLEMRKHCVDCLQKSGDFKAVDPLIHMFDDLENEPITWEITEAIEQLCRWNSRKPIFNALHSGTARIRKQITLLLFDYLDDCIEPVLPELIKALKDPDTDVFVYVSKALEAWATYHNDRNSASDALVACLSDNDPVKRQFAASALGHSGNLDAAFAIINAIHNNPDDTQFHDSAAISLAEISGEYKNKELNQHIDELLKTRNFQGKDLFSGLIKLEDEESFREQNHEIPESDKSSRINQENPPTVKGIVIEPFSFLIEQLKDQDPQNKIEAAEKLGERKNRKATVDLCLLLSDSNHEVQLAAIKALRKIGDQRATETFNFFLPQNTCFHREDIAEAMGALKDTNAVPILASVFNSAWLELRAEIVRTLGRIGGPEVIDPLIIALKDNHPKIRHIAVWKLFDIKHKRAKKALRQAISHENNREVRINIESALSKWDKIG